MRSYAPQVGGCALARPRRPASLAPLLVGAAVHCARVPHRVASQLGGALRALQSIGHWGLLRPSRKLKEGALLCNEENPRARPPRLRSAYLLPARHVQMGVHGTLRRIALQPASLAPLPADAAVRVAAPRLWSAPPTARLAARERTIERPPRLRSALDSHEKRRAWLPFSAPFSGHGHPLKAPHCIRTKNDAHGPSLKGTGIR